MHGTINRSRNNLNNTIKECKSLAFTLSEKVAHNKYKIHITGMQLPEHAWTWLKKEQKSWQPKTNSHYQHLQGMHNRQSPSAINTCTDKSSTININDKTINGENNAYVTKQNCYLFRCPWRTRTMVVAVDLQQIMMVSRNTHLHFRLHNLNYYKHQTV